MPTRMPARQAGRPRQLARSPMASRPRENFRCAGLDHYGNFMIQTGGVKTVVDASLHRTEPAQKAESVERRRAQRYHLSLPIQIVRLAQQRVDVPGKTRDLSANGAYFVLGANIEAGAQIEFYVTLQETRPVSRPVRLRCRGHVTRLERIGVADRWGVAATIDRYQFVRDSLN
jgi:PilZ domain